MKQARTLHRGGPPIQHMGANKDSTRVVYDVTGPHPASGGLGSNRYRCVPKMVCRGGRGCPTYYCVVRTVLWMNAKKMKSTSLGYMLLLSLVSVGAVAKSVWWGIVKNVEDDHDGVFFDREGGLQPIHLDAQTYANRPVYSHVQERLTTSQ